MRSDKESYPTTVLKVLNYQKCSTIIPGNYRNHILAFFQYQCSFNDDSSAFMVFQVRINDTRNVVLCKK